ncbi:LiaF domain-containing protein [Lactococcus termiticola]|uniref:Transporter n=1 Tax=Lactococcus termiticola TaxID=2169526 RepID=A0A2R5HE25_9LACT|nr:LiaF domain-containing protein [Lactococcus termiticola]GBG96313.1 transporter [Lactococcus termiticola]
MSKRLKIIILIEILILIALFFHVASSPRLLVLFALALIFTFLANRMRSPFFRALSLIFWAISSLVFITAGWFWLALIFPIVMFLIFWKNNPREVQQKPGAFYERRAEPVGSSQEGNDVIDLAEVDFRPEGNRLSIRKASGNTKIIVPADVAVALKLTTGSGIVNIFGEHSINPRGLRYFSEQAESYEKRMAIEILVEEGNIEIVRG